MYALVKGGKAYRFTFSRSLAEHIAGWCGPEGLLVERVAFRVGRRLQAMEPSRSGLYAVCSTKTKDDDLVLRITMQAEVAALLTPDHWREIRECWLEPSAGRQA